jgi:hypothetical protein
MFMATLSRNEFSMLNEVQGAFCTTIYLPTHRSGEAALQHADAKALKYQLKLLREQLEKEGMAPGALERYIQPLEALLTDSGFWRKLTEGLAIFLTEGRLVCHHLPFAPDPRLFLANRFYLQPLLPLFEGDGKYYVLNLALETVRLFKGSKYTFEEEDVAAWVPRQIEAVVGYDHEPRNIQVRSVPAGQRGASYHGYGEGKDDRKAEIMSYIREVEKGITRKLNGEAAPLVLTGADYLLAMYQTANSYSSLYPEHIPGNQQHSDSGALHKKTWDVVAPHFNTPRLAHLDKFMQLHDTPQTSTDIREILPAAIYGKVEALFVRKDSDIWGVYDPARAEVEIAPGPDRSNTSLSELAAIQTLLQGGHVYLLEAEGMPYEEAGICALYRY